MARIKTELGEFNRAKYLKPPTLQEIEAFIAELGIPEKQFERFYGIPFATISKIRAGERSLPPSFWAIVYEKIVPTYGVSFIQEQGKSKLAIRLAKHIERQSDLDHGRLTTVKDK